MNVVHSVDAYVLRSIHRRCNYDKDVVEMAKELIDQELYLRSTVATYPQNMTKPDPSKAMTYYINLFNRHQVADVVILPYLDQVEVMHMSSEHLEKLGSIVESMLCHEPFEVVTIH